MCEVILTSSVTTNLSMIKHDLKSPRRPKKLLKQKGSRRLLMESMKDQESTTFSIDSDDGRDPVLQMVSPEEAQQPQPVWCRWLRRSSMPLSGSCCTSPRRSSMPFSGSCCTSPTSPTIPTSCNSKSTESSFCKTLLTRHSSIGCPLEKGVNSGARNESPRRVRNESPRRPMRRSDGKEVSPPQAPTSFFKEQMSLVLVSLCHAIDVRCEREFDLKQSVVFHKKMAKARLTSDNISGAVISLRRVFKLEQELNNLGVALDYLNKKKLKLETEASGNEHHPKLSSFELSKLLNFEEQVNILLSRSELKTIPSDEELLDMFKAI